MIRRQLDRRAGRRNGIRLVRSGKAEESFGKRKKARVPYGDSPRR